MAKVQLNTSMGNITLTLNDELAPISTENFLDYVRSGHYDGTIFHRVIANFMVQGGDPTGTGSGGPGYKFADEIDRSLKHTKSGIFSMANAGPNTNGSQFFITHLATPHLDGKHAVFGDVVDPDSRKVVDKIQAVETGAQDKPIDDVVIESISVETL